MTREQLRDHNAADRALKAAVREAVRILREPTNALGVWTKHTAGINVTLTWQPEPDRRHMRAWDVLNEAGNVAELLMGSA